MSDRVTATFPVDAAVLDLDGTVYRGERLLPGAEQTIRHLRRAGIEVMFLTNKPLEGREHYAAKLRSLDVPAEAADVITSGWVTARYIREHHPSSTAFVIGEEQLVRELETCGIQTTSEAPGDLLVVSMDRTFTYEKLDLALRTVDDDTPIIATNPDRTCPTENGEIPDTAGMIGAVTGVTGRTPDAIVGKPSKTMVETITERWGVELERCLMVGDRPETDMKMGARAGMTTVLVLTGVTDRGEIDSLEHQPDYVIDGIGDLPTLLNQRLTVLDE